MSNAITLHAFLPYRFSQLANQISISLSQIYQDNFEISVPQWRILATLGENKRLQASQIGEMTNMDKVKVSRAVKSLLDRDLLQKTPCPTDSRASDLSLNARGRKLYQRICPLALSWEQELLEPLNSEEKQSLFKILDKLDLQVKHQQR